MPELKKKSEKVFTGFHSWKNKAQNSGERIAMKLNWQNNHGKFPQPLAVQDWIGTFHSIFHSKFVITLLQKRLLIQTLDI